jgi:Secretion system C-terminal sorting domain
MRKVTLVCFSLLTTITVSGQEVISTQGDTYSTGNGKLDFTIGEVVISTGTNGTYDITQGFHQTNWNFVGVEEHEAGIDATVFPNPMDNNLNIRMSKFEHASFALIDANGRIVAENKLSSELTTIDVSTYAPGAYSLLLIGENQKKLKTFKLVKHNQ